MSELIKKCGLLGILFGALLSVAFGSSSVSAVTPYDNLLDNKFTNEIIFHNTDNEACTSIDMTTSYLQYFESPNPHYTRNYHDAMIDSLNQALQTGAWMIHAEAENPTRAYTVYWVEDISANDVYMEFEGEPGDPHLRFRGDTTYLNRAYVGVQNQDECTPYFLSGSGSVRGSSSPPTWYLRPFETNMKIFVSTFQVNYPEDYQGEVIPDTWEPPVTVKEQQPDFTLTISEDGAAHLLYSGNLGYEFDEGATIAVSESDSGCSSGTLLQLYTVENYADIDLNFELEEHGWYTVNVASTEEWVKPWHSCINWVGSHINIGTIGCEVDDISGDYQCREFDASTIYNACVNSEAPFIHFEECKRAFNNIANTVSFGVINPLEKFKYETTSQCRELGTLGNWLGLENKTVCPQFNEEVRNVVTPFMSFGLSLTVLGAMVNKTSKEFM